MLAFNIKQELKIKANHMYVNKLTWDTFQGTTCLIDTCGKKTAYKCYSNSQENWPNCMIKGWKKLLFLMQRKKSIEMYKKHSPKTPVVGTTSKYSVCRTREAHYGGKPTKATLTHAQKCLTSFPVPVAIYKTVGAKRGGNCLVSFSVLACADSVLLVGGSLCGVAGAAGVNSLNA